jgi:hypothetical protein
VPPVMPTHGQNQTAAPGRGLPSGKSNARASSPDRAGWTTDDDHPAATPGAGRGFAVTDERRQLLALAADGRSAPSRPRRPARRGRPARRVPRPDAASFMTGDAVAISGALDGRRRRTPPRQRAR